MSMNDSVPAARDADWLPAGPVRLALISLGILVLTGWAALFYEGLYAAEDGFIAAICRPLAGAPGWSIARYGIGVALWIAMALAMMLPSASTMVLAFADRISRENRAHSSARAVLALIAGYCLVWVVISFGAAALQILIGEGLSRLALPDRATAILAGTAIGFAGLYQFSPTKRGALAACRHPFPFDQPLPVSGSGALRLGMVQGLHCLGCCGAMMAMMLVAGTMNLIWMLAFAVLMSVEKISRSDVLPRLIGAGLVIVGAVLALSSVGFQPLLTALTRL